MSNKTEKPKKRSKKQTSGRGGRRKGAGRPSSLPGAVSLCVVLTENLATKLGLAAEHKQISRSQMVRDILEKHLAKLSS